MDVNPLRNRVVIVVRYKRRLVSEDERRLRQSAYAKRAISLRSLMDAKRRKVLGDMVLASFM